MGKGAPPEVIVRRGPHPDSPVGGGGPGHFQDPGTLSDLEFPDDPRPHPLAPAARAEPFADVDLPDNAKAPPPPKTGVTQVAKESTDRVTVDIKVEVLEDGTDASLGSTARTKITSKTLAFTYPGAETGQVDGETRITKLLGKFTLNGTIPIQTVYGPKTSANARSVYGRGTTADDKKEGNVTLGFHENCHRVDYVDSLLAGAVPTFFAEVGMTPTEFQQAKTDFQTALNDWIPGIRAQSKQTTDEVGYTLSKCIEDGKCSGN